MSQEDLNLTFKANLVCRQKVDSAESLATLVERFEKEQIKRAPHQRGDDAWTNARKLAWVQRCLKASEGKIPDPLGIVCQYAIQTENFSHQYLNDGLQRISASRLAKNHPEQFGMNQDDVNSILTNTYIHVQNRQYNNHREAADDFVLVNSGTGLEPVEKHRHVLVYNERWPIWKDELLHWSDALRKTLAPYARTIERRNARLSLERDDYHLFCVAILGRPKSYDRTEALEKCVTEIFEKCSPSVVSPKIKSLQAYSAEIETAWRKSESDARKAMQETLARWCLGTLFLYGQDLLPINRRTEFFQRLFAKTQGLAHLNYVDRGDRSQNLKRLDCFRKVARLLEFPIEEPEKREKHPLREILRPGYEVDHLMPFSDYGDGPVQPMPAKLNASKNARAPIKSA